MAYERQKLKNELKISLSTDEAIATPEAVVRTAKALGTLMDPIISDITNVMYYDNIETA